MLKSAKQAEDGRNQKMEPVKAETTFTSPEKKNAPTSSDQDLDVFLLGDLGDSDEGPGTVPQFMMSVVYYYLLENKTCL